MTRWIHVALVTLLVLAGRVAVSTQTPAQQPPPPPTKPILYVAVTSRADLGGGTVQDEIRDLIPPAFFTNADRFDTFPNYAFSYGNAMRYMWFKEYVPDDWAGATQYVNQNRWRLAGSWITDADSTIVSPESLMRQAVYGRQFFRREFNRVAADVYLPSASSVSFALPEIAAQSGFSGVTLMRSPGGPTPAPPFSIGRWRGVDGSEILATLSAREDVTTIAGDLAASALAPKDVTTFPTGRSVSLRVLEVGDGSADAIKRAIGALDKSVADKDGPIEVRVVAPDQVARDVNGGQRASLPVFEGEVMTAAGGAGALTSGAAMKRLNRQNEVIADAAERAGVAAMWIDDSTYPTDRLKAAWIRMLSHQTREDLGGAAIPEAYQFSWNDELISANQFAGVLTNAATAVASHLDTNVEAGGVPLVVYNAAAFARHDLVDATVHFPSRASSSIRVIDKNTNQDVPAQVIETHGDDAHIAFRADVPPVGFTVFEVKAAVASAHPSALSVTSSTIENARYTVKLDANGDIASIYDREVGAELLKAPIRLELRDDAAPEPAALQIPFDVIRAPAREFPSAPTVHVIEHGPARATIEVTRHAAGSTFVERISLTDGGDRVDVDTTIDWRSPNTLLKAAFPFAASNPKATYDLGLGTIARGNDTVDHSEVAAQRWADITDATGTFGVAVMNDSKYGWDKPADNILRLTLLHTPKSSTFAATTDLGHQHVAYAIEGHRGDWTAGRVPTVAASLNQPLLAFQSSPHSGASGHSISLVSIDDTTGQVAIAALKKAEESDEIVVRVQEQFGRPARVRVVFADKIDTVRELNAAEETLKPAAATDGALFVDLHRYQTRTFAVRLARSATTPQVTRATAPVDLPFNLDGMSLDSDRVDGNFDGRGHTLAGELVPREVRVDDVWFKLGSSAAGAKNVLVPHGESMALPKGSFNRVYVLAAAVGGDIPATFAFSGGKTDGSTPVTIRDWEGAIGQAESRLNEPRLLREPAVAPLPNAREWTPDAIQADLVVRTDATTGNVSGIDEIRAAFVKREEIAWVGSHRHAAGGNQIAVPSYVFIYGFDLPVGAMLMRLPSNDRIRILAITAVQEPSRLIVATTLY